MKVQNNFHRLRERFERQIKQRNHAALEEWANDTVAAMREIVPVKTGRLRDSIGWRFSGDDSVLIEADAPYAAAVEFGTVKRGPRPFFYPVLEEMMPRMGDYVERQ